MYFEYVAQSGGLCQLLLKAQVNDQCFRELAGVRLEIVYNTVLLKAAVSVDGMAVVFAEAQQHQQQQRQQQRQQKEQHQGQQLSNAGCP